MAYYNYRYRDQEEYDRDYQRYISNIAYRFGFEVIEENGSTYKVKDGERTLLIEAGTVHPHHLWWKTKLLLTEEYDFYGNPHEDTKGEDDE